MELCAAALFDDSLGQQIDEKSACGEVFFFLSFDGSPASSISLATPNLEAVEKVWASECSVIPYPVLLASLHLLSMIQL